MTEKEKLRRGEWYDAAGDSELISELVACRDKLHDFNLMRPADLEGRDKAMRAIIGKAGRKCTILSPFLCDYGSNISLGDNVYINFGMVILDEAPVTIGSNVFIGPQCGFYTAIHPLDAARRNLGIEKAAPITIEDDVWIGGGVRILPGVRVGRGSVVGAGSVLTKDVPPHTVAAGNPARVIKNLNAAECEKND